MEINEEVLMPYLIYDEPIKYTENITIYPVHMRDIIEFQQYISSITIRKNSIFRTKEIIKMSYLDFIYYCSNNFELSEQYKIKYLPILYGMAYKLLELVCNGQEIKYSTKEGLFIINGEIVDSKKFDDLRRIIIIQNNVDFDIDEFMNYETELALKKAQEYEANKTKETYTIEDYIDSYMIAMKSTEEDVKKLTIRKFWRHIKRILKYDNYKIMQTASCSGMVTFKNPIQNWMSSIIVEDRYSNVKGDEKMLKGKIG